MIVSPARIAVLGAGSWGTALAILLSRSGHDVRLWARAVEHRDALRSARRNETYLPGHPFPDGLEIVDDIASATTGGATVLVAVPSHAFQEVLLALRAVRPGALDLFWATKGFEPGTGALLSDVASGLLDRESRLGLLSGPTFAGEVASGLPAAVTLASSDSEYASRLASLFGERTFRVYTATDLIGVQVGGAVKNVLAVAAGIADGLGFGANTRAALIARGLAEMMRLGEAMSARRETFMGLAGLGDLVLTCTDDQSRNRRFGLQLAAGQSVDEAFRSVGQVVEGAVTASVVNRLASRFELMMPICEQVYRVVEGDVGPQQAVDELLARGAGPEHG